jgi:hypothetical protein
MPTQDGKPRNTAKKTEPTPPRPARAKKKRPADASPDAPAAAPLAAVQPGDEKYLPTAWGSDPEQAGGPVDLELPSGQLVLARKPGLQQLMVEGVLHKMDNLTALVDSKHVRKGKGGRADINVQSLLGDQDALANILHTVDRVLCAVVLRPGVQMTPNDPTRRVRGVIYADTVGIEDKMFIFNWALGGSRDIERFRRESEEVVGSVAVGEPVGDETE